MKRILLLIVGCVASIFVAVILMNLETPRKVVATPPQAKEQGTEDSETEPAAPKVSSAPHPQPPTESPGKPEVSGHVEDSDLAYLREKKLAIPVAGVTASQLRDSYSDPRSEGRLHEALDIMVPEGTPVLAAADGVVRKLFNSVRGGIMLYEIDSARPIVYYYAHLKSYADDIKEGKQIKRGEVIAYVGDTGNAGPGNFHLHFGILKTSELGKWSGGEPINPFPLLIEPGRS